MTVFSFRTLVATSVVLLAMLAEELEWALEEFNLSFEEANKLQAFSPCFTRLTLIAVSLILSHSICVHMLHMLHVNSFIFFETFTARPD